MSRIGKGAATVPPARATRRRRWGLGSGALALGIVIVLSVTVGSRHIPLTETLHALWAPELQNDQHLIVRVLRIPRTVIAILAGLALGVAGAVMQAVTRNPLAEPGLLGVNAGAALAVLVGMTAFGLASMMQYVWCAFVGAGLAGIAVFALGQSRGAGTHPVRLVLAGAGLSVTLMSAAGIILLNASTDVFDGFRHWAAGSVETSTGDRVGVLAVAVAAGCAAACAIVGNLNALAMGRDVGQALGVNVRATLRLACLSVMLLAGAATAAVGPIGFVGLVAPHVARWLSGPDYRWILPLSALYAAILLLGADVLGRVVAAPAEVAAGIVASLVGGPFFVMVACKYRLNRL
ncbi:iron ABC transporter permease [Burkholderia sp. IDO3]|uniref:FecCD family ABC transporter permease n=1 Tax=Burkholderia sp. IDO3 TaxID=1705310 RepID=UPI000BBA77F4|nr:iron ABC transporter permease [Burkholderia sp. IDO3]AXK67827.1 iron ABC transporter permease [Burkholderia sp. IDO3]PCD60758.1 Fe(3+)-siderophore ABC transporter permease [Burkholderia sp. IDO3]